MKRHGPWARRFRNCGYKFTIPREAIIELLHEKEGHLSSEDIYFEVHKKYPAIGLTTVYRTLDILVRMSVVAKFDFGDGRSRYELIEHADKENHHHHLICTGCNKIIDYTDFIEDELEFLKKAEKGLAKKYDFKITNHIVNFYGLCSNCKIGN